MMTILLILVGLFIGAVVYESPTAAFLGVILGYLLGSVFSLRGKVNRLIEQLGPKIKNEENHSIEENLALDSTQDENSEINDSPTEVIADEIAPNTFTVGGDNAVEVELEMPKWITAIKNYFTTGNIVAKIGVVVLFFGVAFLLSYAVKHSLMSIEARLGASFIAGLVMLAIGWIQRDRRRSFALTLQGGGIGILYITVFSSLMLAVINSSFIVYFALSVIGLLSVLLALLQNTRSLAFLGLLGGFLAPLLVSSPTGNPIQLFSHYLMLDIVIVLIAWYKTWRSVTLLGFVFTFLVAGVWSILYFDMQWLFAMEIFLVLFTLLYLSIPILFLLQKEINLKNYLDTTLVFGTPFIVFAIQGALVQRFMYGLAWTCLFLGVIYTLVSACLYKKRIRNSNLLAESYLSIGVIFLSLMIPYIFSKYWVGAIWALEGMLIIWIGVRQQRYLARLFGVLLQVFAGFSHMDELANGLIPIFSVNYPLIINPYYLASVLLTIAGFCSAYLLHAEFSTRRKVEYYLAGFLFCWGLFWWYGGNLAEFSVHKHLLGNFIYLFVMGLFTFSTLVAELIFEKTSWKWMGYWRMNLLPVMILITVFGYYDYPFQYYGYISWPFAFIVWYSILFMRDKCRQITAPLWHAVTFWLMVLLVLLQVAWTINTIGSVNTIPWPTIYSYKFVLQGLIPALFILLLQKGQALLPWPLRTHEIAYKCIGTIALIAGLTVWCIQSYFEPGDNYFMPYIPFLNSLDLIFALVLYLILTWPRSVREWLIENKVELGGEHSKWNLTVGVLGFLWLNAVLARVFHFWFQLPYSLEYLMNSRVVETSVSIMWAILALIVTSIATRKAWREMWMAGAVLVGLLVMKLVFIDVTLNGTIERVISFIGVGVLLIIIGFISPVPPKLKEAQQP